MYRFSPFSLDTTNQCLLRQCAAEEVRIHLPPKAFAVLQHLVEHSGKLVLHNDLMEKVWPDTFVQPEVLSSHIRDIRAALRDNARKPRFIETVSRKGYRFIAAVGFNDVTKSHYMLDPTAHRLVGREAELAKLAHAYRQARGGKRQLVFITGESGMGKTALCNEFLLRISTNESVYTAWGQCIEGYGIQEPYFPMLKAISELCRTGGSPVIQVFKSKAPTCIVQFPDFISPEERAVLDPDVRSATSGRVLRELLNALESTAELRPVIIVLDDLQWADRASVDVLSEFARRHTFARILLIGIFRPLEAFLSGNPIGVLKEDLLAHRICSEIELLGITKADVDEYLSPMISESNLRADLASLLYRRSEGNPLFMIAALEHSFEQGLLASEGGELQLKTPLDRLAVDIPQSLKRVLQTQVDHLAPEERRILEAASIEGTTFSPLVIASAIDVSRQQIEDICHNLANQSQIIRVSPESQTRDGLTGPSYEFVHVLYRDVLYARQSPWRRAERHRTISHKLEEVHRNRLEEFAAEFAQRFEQHLD